MMIFGKIWIASKRLGQWRHVAFVGGEVRFG